MRRFLALSLITGFCAAAALAQITTAEIRGSVQDSQQLSVVSARVEAVNEGTGQRFTATSNELGEYLLRFLPVGQYSMQVEKAGFKKFRQENIKLTSGQVVGLDVQLEIGAVSEAVTVTSQLPVVDTQTGTLATVIDEKGLVALPFSNRNILNQVGQAPGISRVSTADGPSFGQQSINVNGNRSNATNVMMDGAAMYYAHRGVSTTQPPPDAVQEIRIATNGVEAEFKRGVAAITTITRSGTNEYHGSLWNYLRNDDLNARSFFIPAVTKQRYNQFGGAGGGPIRRNKAFFFASYQGLRNPSAAISSSAFPPTAAERTGDFSGSSGARIIDPLTNQPFPNATIPSTRMDPIALKLLALVPGPNSPNGHYIVQVPVPNNNTTIMGRVDYDFTPGDRSTVRYFVDSPTSLDPFPNGATVAGYDTGTPKDRNQNATYSHVHTFSPSLLMTMRASYGRFYYSERNNTTESLTSLGAKFVFAGGPGGLPALIVPGRFTAAAAPPGGRITDTYELGSIVSWFRGKHEVKFGVDVYKMRFYYADGGNSNGQFTFNGTYTGTAMADYMLGQASLMSEQQLHDKDTRDYSPGFFFQDRWRATRKLTLSVGLRWDIFTPWRFVNYMGYSLVPGAQSTVIPKAPKNLLYERDPGYPLQTSYVNPGPRVAFAYDVFGKGKTSIRGAYGISYMPLIGQLVNQNSQPYGVDVSTGNVGPLSDPYRYVNNPYISGSSLHPDLSNPVYSFPIFMGSSLGAVKIHTPYAQSMNFTIAQQIPSGTVVQVSYVGTLGRHEGTLRDQNPAVYIPGMCGSSPCSTVANQDSRRIYAPNFSYVNGYATDGLLDYNALQIQISRRLQKGLTFSAFYTFSKAIDDGSRNDASNNWAFQNPYNRAAERGIGDYSIANSFVASWVWELPFWQHHNSLPAKVLGGWRLAGVATLNSGLPFYVLAGKDNALTGVLGTGNNQRPNVLGGPILSPGRSRAAKIARYFDTTMFIANQPGTYGNEGRNILVGPGFIDSDLSMSKDFAITERKRIEFRWEAFNVLNRPNFSNPGNNLSTPTNFGVITSAGSGRVMEGVLRFQF